MKAFSSAFRSRYTRSVEQRTSRLDPDVRRQLADEIESKLKIQQPPGASEEEEVGGDEEAKQEVTDSTLGDSSPSPPPGRDYGEAGGGESFEDEEDETDIAIDELEVSLGESCEALAKSEEAERFLGSRVAKYRSMLENCAKNIDRMAVDADAGERDGLMGETKESDDVEGGGAAATSEALPTEQEIRAMREKHRKDEESLDKVVEMHKSILADVERMRRKIQDLEKKREDILDRRDECRDFLVAAAQAEDAEIMAGGREATGVGSCPLSLPAVGKTHGRDTTSEKETDLETGELLEQNINENEHIPERKEEHSKDT